MTLTARVRRVVAQREVAALRATFLELRRQRDRTSRTAVPTLEHFRAHRAKLRQSAPANQAACAVLLHLPKRDVLALPDHGGAHWPALWRKALLRRDALTPAERARLLALPEHPDWHLPE